MDTNILTNWVKVMEDMGRKAMAFYTENSSIYVVSTDWNGADLQTVKVSNNGGSIAKADVMYGDRWLFNWSRGGFIFEMNRGTEKEMYTSRVTRVAGVHNFMPRVRVVPDEPTQPRVCVVN